jgi:hypothetical protein
MLCRDMPPAGGFEAVKYKRNMPFRGPGGLVILGGVTAICTYGFYRLGKGNLEKRQVWITNMGLWSAGQETCRRRPLIAKRGHVGIRPQFILSHSLGPYLWRAKLIWTDFMQGTATREGVVAYPSCAAAAGRGGSGCTSAAACCVGEGKGDHEGCQGMGGKHNLSSMSRVGD